MSDEEPSRVERKGCRRKIGTKLSQLGYSQESQWTSIPIRACLSRRFAGGYILDCPENRRGIAVVREPSIFQYGEREMSYLSARDKRLAAVIEELGPLRREVYPSLFAALTNSIVGQQISTKAQATVWNRLCALVGEVTPDAVLALSDDELQSAGLTYRKVGDIKGAAQRVVCGEVNLEGLADLPGAEVCRALSSLPGVGVWTAEMLMIFSMQRPDVFSWDDLGIQRGLRMVHHHRRITPELFAKYRRRYSPYGTVASLYLWEVAGGAVSGLRDWAPKKKR